MLRAGWNRIGEAARKGGTDEHSMVTFLQKGIERAGLWTDHGPNVSVGANSADSHYEPTAASSKPIRSGDFVLIDIWAKLAHDPQAVWYDITWTGVVDREPTERERTSSRPSGTPATQPSLWSKMPLPSNVPIAGWQADDASRAVIRAAGLAE